MQSFHVIVVISWIGVAITNVICHATSVKEILELINEQQNDSSARTKRQITSGFRANSGTGALNLDRDFQLKVCENDYDDIGLCLPPNGECKATRGVNIGSCQFSATKQNGVCCQHLPCSVPEVRRPELEAILELGLRNQVDLRATLNMIDFSKVSPVQIPAIVETCGLRGPLQSPNPRGNSITFRHHLSAKLGRDGQIINGLPSTSNVPWMLALWIRTGKPGRDIATCGAALVSSSYAITAAHCVENKNMDYVLRGGSNLNHLDSRRSVQMEIDWIRVHPKFNPFNFEHDIALIRFERPVRFTRNLFPVCLPPPPSVLFPTGGELLTDYIDDEVTVHGWGCLDENCRVGINVPTLLQEASLSIVSNDLAMCWFQNDSVTAGAREYIPSKLFLVGGDADGSPSTCTGDSGSPIVRQKRTGFGGFRRQWEVIGLVSWSKGCGRRFRPSVWTRVETFVHWIVKNMNS